MDQWRATDIHYVVCVYPRIENTYFGWVHGFQNCAARHGPVHTTAKNYYAAIESGQFGQQFLCQEKVRHLVGLWGVHIGFPQLYYIRRERDSTRLV